MQQTVKIKNGEELVMTDSALSLIRYQQIFGRSMFADVTKDEIGPETILGIAYVLSEPEPEKNGFDPWVKKIALSDFTKLAEAVGKVLESMSEERKN